MLPKHIAPPPQLNHGLGGDVSFKIICMRIIKQYKKKNNLGFSLLELILAVAIFSLGSYVTATMLIDSNISTKLNTERIQAMLYAKEGIEAVRSIRDADSDLFFTPNEGNYGLVDTNNSWELTDTPDLIDNKYTRTVTISEGPALNADSPTKSVSINIAWELTPARVASTTLMTVLSDWR
jgi:prepilin-type N-terminal cleavage/methylation domain-containing protein